MTIPEPVTPSPVHPAVIEAVMAHLSEIEKATLEHRAKLLARAAKAEIDESATVEVLTFTLGHEEYAIEISHVREVRAFEQLTPVPCTPPFVVGVVNLQGEILSLIDIRHFLGIAQEGIADLHYFMVVKSGDLQVGIFARQVGEVVKIALSSFEETDTDAVNIGDHYVKGVTSRGLIWLNLQAILTDERLIINEELS